MKTAEPMKTLFRVFLALFAIWWVGGSYLSSLIY